MFGPAGPLFGVQSNVDIVSLRLLALILCSSKSRIVALQMKIEFISDRFLLAKPDCSILI